MCSNLFLNSPMLLEISSHSMVSAVNSLRDGMGELLITDQEVLDKKRIALLSWSFELVKRIDRIGFCTMMGPDLLLIWQTCHSCTTSATAAAAVFRLVHYAEVRSFRVFG